MDIKKISDIEYFVGINRVVLIDGKIVHVTARGEQTYDMALAYKEVCHILHEQVDGKVCYMIDLNECGKNAPGARDIWKELSNEEKTLVVATYGLNPVAHVIASFVIGTYNNSNLKFFKTQNEAEEWLRDMIRTEN